MELQPNSIFFWTNASIAKKQWGSPQTTLLTWCTFSFIFLLYCKSGYFCRQGRTWKWYQSCSIVFVHAVYWAVTDIAQFIGIINTLYSEKKRWKTFSNYCIRTLSRKVHAMHFYVKAPDSMRMLLITVYRSFQLSDVWTFASTMHCAGNAR